MKVVSSIHMHKRYNAWYEEEYVGSVWYEEEYLGSVCVRRSMWDLYGVGVCGICVVLYEEEYV